jgi:allantoate deiminase
MSIRVERIRDDIAAIARCTLTPGAGATRPTFTPAWRDACRYVHQQADAAGCEVFVDAFGNLHARPASLGWDTQAWLVGSHIDTVPHGGDYDGVAGVVTALELLRSANDDKIQLPVELIVFAEEEGPTFGLGMIGSRAWVGELSEQQLHDLKNSAGQSYLEAGRPLGVDRSRFAEDRLNPYRYLGLIEVHIEQGPGMWRRDQRLAVVRAIAGRRQYRVTVHGEANHAGATAMSDRKDALAAAARIVTALESAVKQLADTAVLTVGRLAVHPNAVNVIADRVEFTIDLRAPEDDLLTHGDAIVRSTIDSIVQCRNLRHDLEQTESIGARPMNPWLVEALRKDGDLPVTVSGALHDSAILAPHVPTVMLFIPSRDGISHNPAEFSRVADLAAAARAVEKLVRRRTVARLNQLDQEAFTEALAGIYEHSPWIPNLAWEKRPFASLADLHEKLAAVVATASPDERLSLIRAHPDLVGRLAREGRLTRESTAEQAAAGLTTLTPDEVDAFERYNAQYREKFGFPFVICARQNRKDAILAAFPRRLANAPEAEIATALSEINKIAQLRLADAVWEV